MSKLLPFLVAGVGASSVSVGGVFMLKKTGGESGASKGQQDSNQSDTKLSADLDFKDLTNFKTKKGGECAQKYLEPLDYSTEGNGAQQISGSNKIDATYFSSETNGTAESCLVINWERTDSSDANPQKGKGEFSWLGTFVKGKKGMVAFTTIKSPTSNDKVHLEGGIYFLENESNTWKIKKYKEHNSTSKKEVDANKPEEWFPKNGTAIADNLITSSGQAVKDYGWFVKDVDDIKKMCTSSEQNTCPTGTNSKTQSFKASGIGTPETPGNDQSKKVSDGSSNVTTAIPKIYGESELTLTTAFDSFKGTGKNENLIKPESSASQ